MYKPKDNILMNLPRDILTPYHIVDIEQLKKNLSIITNIRQRSECKVLYAMKCCSNAVILENIRSSIDGACASGLFEARLAKECLFNEIHTFSTAYSHSNIDEISKYSNYIAFNSLRQLNCFRHVSSYHNCSVGLRINPMYSEILNYNVDPCHKHSRFGVNAKDLENIDVKQLDFFLLHNMCEQYTDTFSRVIDTLISKYSKYFSEIKHINLGGGQLYTRDDYLIEEAIDCISKLHNMYGVVVYIEPGEAIMMGVAYLVCSVIDIIDNGMMTAILDSSAICHMPDIVYSKYHCEIMNGDLMGDKTYHYKLAGASCYAGDIFGEFAFEKPLEIGDKVVINYTSVKSSMFNGIPYPSIVLYTERNGYELIKEYSYNTYLSII